MEKKSNFFEAFRFNAQRIGFEFFPAHGFVWKDLRTLFSFPINLSGDNWIKFWVEDFLYEKDFKMYASRLVKFPFQFLSFLRNLMNGHDFRLAP